MELISKNVKAKELRNAKLLIHSACLADEYPEILSRFSKDHIPLSVCLEELHINKIGFKLNNILHLSKIREVDILTMDGSPHCIQLHFLGEHLTRSLNVKIPISHYVVEKGTVYKVSVKAIRLARHLSMCMRLLNEVGVDIDNS